jgi:hypothetical protein
MYKIDQEAEKKEILKRYRGLLKVSRRSTYGMPEMLRLISGVQVTPFGGIIENSDILGMRCFACMLEL